MTAGSPRPARYLTSVALGALVAAAAVTPAAAQSTDDGLFTLLGRMVLGFGTETVAIDTPQAVTVIDQDDLDRAQATTPAELFDTVPGVQAIGSERVSGLSFNIRGIGDLSASDESKIIVNVDGVPKFYEQYRVGSLFTDVELYKSVEVLRGPASSTLYGSGALGGVVNFVTKDASDFIKPGKTNALRFKTSYDSNGDGVLGSVIWASRPSDSFEILGALNYREADDYQTGYGADVPGSAFSSVSGLVKGTLRFGNDNEQTLRLSYQRWESDANDTEYSQTGTLGAFGTVDRDTTDQTVVLAYENPFSGNPLLDLNAALSFSDTQVIQSDASAPIPSGLFADAEYAYRTWGLKVENTSEATGANWENYLTYGVQLTEQDRIAETSMGPLNFHPEGSERKIGLYAQNEFILNDKLTLIPGIRLDFIDQEPDATVPGGQDISDTALSPKFAAHYRLNDQWALFGSVARTERHATLDELYSYEAPGSTYPGGRVPSISLEKETAQTAEVGFSYQKTGIRGANDQLSFKTTGFYNDLDNLIATNPNTGLSTPVPYYVNVEDAKIYGVEIEAAYESERFFSRAAYSFVRGEDKATGETLASIPAQDLSLTLGGRMPSNGVEYGWTGHFVDGITTAAGSYGGYTTHDLFVGWTPKSGVLEDTQIRLSVENAFDKGYRNNLSGDDGRGRTFKISLTKTFDS